MVQHKTNSSYRVTEETIDSIFVLWRYSAVQIDWNPLFVLPPWLQAWWRAFGASRQPTLLAVWRRNELIGIAPYVITGDTVCFWGSGDVCDYMDVMVVPGREKDLFTAVLDHVRQKKVTRLSFESLRPDSATMNHLSGAIELHGGTVTCKEEDVSLGLDLPPTWNDYLTGLSGKERHEVRRKMRRLLEAGHIRFRSVRDGELDERDCKLFLQIFSANRSDKAQFMTPRMASFFHDLAEEMAREKLLRLFFSRTGL